ncbi:MAG: hypothetical protein M8865_12775 [marine benthic group bacterium]|jgi:hypothetical protein|nr:hypothetical protein [Gemmatimonadota bacterium]
MTGPRRYDEHEIAEILRRASEADTGISSTPARLAGLTLAEIQLIAGEVGIEPHGIERAARELESVRTGPAATWLGAPRAVSRTVGLPRRMTDDEWTRLVVLLRETFDARGEIETTGPIRTWHNGNLEVHVEPVDDGYRLRMRTLKGELEAISGAALSILMVALIMAIAILSKRGIDPALFISAIFAAGGLGMLSSARLRLPGWAAERATQMDEIAAHVERMLRELPAPGVDRLRDVENDQSPR